MKIYMSNSVLYLVRSFFSCYILMRSQSLNTYVLYVQEVVSQFIQQPIISNGSLLLGHTVHIIGQTSRTLSLCISFQASIWTSESSARIPQLITQESRKAFSRSFHMVNKRDYAIILIPANSVVKIICLKWKNCHLTIFQILAQISKNT